MALEDRKPVNVYTLSNVILCLLDTAADNSHALWSLLRERHVIKRFLFTSMPKTGTSVLSRSFISCRGIPKIPVKRAYWLLSIPILSGVASTAGRSAIKLSNQCFKSWPRKDCRTQWKVSANKLKMKKNVESSKGKQSSV